MTGQYTVWNTDSNGNYVSTPFAAVSGSNTALESLETSFHQDLNGDGVIGIPPATKPAAITPVPNVTAVQLLSNDTFSFREDMGANVSVANAFESFATSNHQSVNPCHDGLMQLLNLFEAIHHDQALNTGAHDQFVQEAHLANLIAGQFHFH